MWPNLIMCNANSADVMPTHTVIPNDIMHLVCDMHAQVSWVYLHNIDAPHLYLLAWYPCMLTVDYKNNHFTFCVIITSNANENLPMMILIA